jgi:hypothetical protein
MTIGKKLLLSLIGASASSRTALPVARALPPAKPSTIVTKSISSPAVPVVASLSSTAKPPAKRVISTNKLAGSASTVTTPSTPVVATPKVQFAPAKRLVNRNSTTTTNNSIGGGGLASRIPFRMRSAHEIDDDALGAGATSIDDDDSDSKGNGGGPLVTSGSGNGLLVGDDDNAAEDMSFGFASNDESGTKKPVFVISNVRKIKSVGGTAGAVALLSGAAAATKKRPLPSLRSDRDDDDDNDNASTPGGVRKRAVVLVKKGRGGAVLPSTPAVSSNAFNVGGRQVVKKARR